MDHVDFEAPIRVPGTYQPDWIPDSDVSSCQLCNIEFTLIRRRHHCRSCGKIFCAECCHLKAKLPYLNNKEVRVCDSCVRLLAVTLTGPPVANILSPSSNSITTEDRRTNQSTLNSTSTDNSIEAPTLNSDDLSNIVPPGDLDGQNQQQQPERQGLPLPTASASTSDLPSADQPIQGVLKTSSGSRSRTLLTSLADNTSLQQQTLNKQVMFSDGLRPGTDLCESSYPAPRASDSISGLERRHRHFIRSSSKSRRKRGSRHKDSNPSMHEIKHVTLSDGLGFLPPIVIKSNLRNQIESQKQSNLDNISAEGRSSSFSSVFGQDVAPDLDLSNQSNDISTSNHENSNNIHDNQVGSFAELARRTGNNDSTVKFILLKNFYIHAKIIDKSCCMRKKNCMYNPNKNISDGAHSSESVETSSASVDDSQLKQENSSLNLIQKMMDPGEANDEFWYFRSEGLASLGQNEIIFVLNKPNNEISLPRDVFKLYLTIHELSLRGQAFGNLGNLLFNDGLFGNKNIAGVLFTRPIDGQCFTNLILPTTPFLIAILIQRWEVPWSKVFPLRLLLRLGIEYRSFPFMMASVRDRPPVYYEVGHTIIGILADLRNYRYSVESIPRMSIIIDKAQKKVTIKFPKSYYQQVMKVLSNSNNEHVLSMVSDICNGVSSHLVSVQNDDGQHDSQVFTKDYELFDIAECDGHSIGASFVIFSGALKATQPGQITKISVVEDGLLIQIQSHTMLALRNSIQSMSDYTIEKGGSSDMIQSVSIVWISDEDIPTDAHGVKSPIDGQPLDKAKNIRVQNGADYVGERYFIRWTDVFLSKNDEQDLNEIDVSRLAEEVAQSFCFSMTKQLDRLIEEGRDVLALRLILNESIDEIGFDVGSNGSPLPISYIRDLDATILPVLSSINGSMNLVIELFFYILRT